MSKVVNRAGRHLIADMWSLAPHTMEYVEDILTEGARRSGATPLESNYHHFGEGHGFTGVTLLAESHISIHTWPEKDFAALDIFMCGNCDPQIALDYIKDKLNPKRVVVGAFNRGVET